MHLNSSWERKMDLFSDPPFGRDFWDWLYECDCALPSYLRITADEEPEDEYDADPDEIDAHCRELKRTRKITPPQEYHEFLANIRIVGGTLGTRFALDEVSPPENITDVFCGIWRLQFVNVELRPDSVNPLVPLFDMGGDGLYCLYLGEPAKSDRFPVVEVSHAAGCRFAVQGGGVKKFLAATIVRRALENSSQPYTPIEIARRVAQIDPCASNYYRLYKALRDTGDADGAETALNAARAADYSLGHTAACNVQEWFAHRTKLVTA